MSIPATIRIPAADPTPPTAGPLLVSARELAAMLSTSIATVRRWDASGKLPLPVRIGGTVRWRADDIAAWIEAGCPARGSTR